MRCVRILTLIGDYNIGNKLQNYALSFTISKYNNVETVWNTSIKKFFKRIINRFIYRNKRNHNFIIFSRKYIKEKRFIKSENANYIIGSDQVWNYNFADLEWFFGNKLDKGVLNSYAASFGIDSIPDNLKDKYVEGLSKFKNISVREESGKILAEKLTDRNDIEVVLDPTMLLSGEEWDLISKRPKKLDLIKNERYILTYFLGNLSEERKQVIDKIAKENDCHVINLLDSSDLFYNYGPSEFLYLEKHAFLICTDSFHSSVFAIIYGRPFIVYDREQDGFDNMGSRIDTLLEKFNLEDRKYNGVLTNDDLKINYDNAYKILEKEKLKSIAFIEKILDCEVK